MSACGSCLRVSGYVSVVLIAMYAYFHLECQREKEETEKTTVKEKFRPEETDVKDVPLGYCKYGESITLDLSIEFILMQSAPCALVKLIMFFSFKNSFAEMKGYRPAEDHNVTIYDARKKSPGSFHNTGFTLVELDEEPVTTDWRTNVMSDENADVTKFHQQMEPHIRKMYPEAKKILWTMNVVRGGDKFLDQPKAVGSPHLDYHQNKTKRIEFHEKYPAMDLGISDVFGFVSPKILMGEMDDENGTFGVMLGVWKPIHPAAVCDHPLAVMDARTFHPDNQSPNNLHLGFGFFTFNNLNGAISYSPDQKWFYYSFQTTKEVLVFHHYSKDKWLSNPHTSFLNKNCPEGTESRISVELRVALFF